MSAAFEREYDEPGAAMRRLLRTLDGEDAVSGDAEDGHAPSVVRFVMASEFAAAEETHAQALVTDAAGGAVVPASGLVLMYGNGGAGKTTLALDLAVHLATGRDWLGLASPVRPLRVGVIENEGPRALFRSKLARKLAAWSDAGERIFVLEEPWQGMTFRDGGQREALAALVADMELDVLVAGPLARLGMQGGGTLDEVGEFTALVADVQRRCGRPLTVLLVHHENRAGQVSGAWEGVPDTLIHVQAQGHGRTRLYWQKARWSSALHGTKTNLIWAENEGFEVEEREEVTEADVAEAILSAARETPGASWTLIRERVKGKSATQVTALRDRLLTDGLLVNVPKRKNGLNLWAADDPALNRSESGTEPERLPLASPAREAADASVPPFRRSIGTGNGTERADRGHSPPENCRPLPGDPGYLKFMFTALERGLITEGEFHRADRIRRLVELVSG